MTLLEQCQVWHIHDQHQKIFDAIEALSPEQRTADTDMELARACNNLADPETRDGRALLRRAIGLLEAHQAELQDTYSWNFRMGYAYYYLDQEGPALRYFIRALDLHPGDGPDVNTAEEVQSLISDCRERLALPWFQQQFRERAAAAWAAFRQGEAGLLNLLGQGQTQQAAVLCKQLLAPVVEEICPALQTDGSCHQLCCSAAGSLPLAIALDFFRQQMPEPLRTRWDVIITDRPDGAASFAPEQLPPGIQTAEGDPESGSPARFCYRALPDPDPDADWRMDVTDGVTSCPPLLAGYLENDDAEIDLCHRHGIAAGFFCWPLSSGQDAFSTVLEDLQAALDRQAGPEACTITGYARGTFCGYLDFLAWDLPAVLDAARDFFAGSGLDWANFHSFRRDVSTVRLFTREDKPALDPETGSLLHPQDIEALESFCEDGSGYYYKMLDYLQHLIQEGVQSGQFTEGQARRDLQIALWYAFACNNIGEYEFYYRAAQWMPDSEPAAAGCGAWYYRYSCSLTYCGRLEEARRYAEAGTEQEPSYPWIWLQAAKLRAYFGDRAGALEAVRQGLALVPGDYEFLTLQEEIRAGASLEQMEYHWIDPGADGSLQEDDDPDAVEKLRSIACITTDAKGLEQFYAIFRPDPAAYQRDDPYCSFPYTVKGRRFEVVFQMNEAALSKLDPRWLRTQKQRMDSGRWLTRQAGLDETGTLVQVLIRLGHQVSLIYQTSRRDAPYFQVWLDQDGNLAARPDREPNPSA